MGGFESQRDNFLWLYLGGFIVRFLAPCARARLLTLSLFLWVEKDEEGSKDLHFPERSVAGGESPRSVKKPEIFDGLRSTLFLDI